MRGPVWTRSWRSGACGPGIGGRPLCPPPCATACSPPASGCGRRSSSRQRKPWGAWRRGAGGGSARAGLGAAGPGGRVGGGARPPAAGGRGWPPSDPGAARRHKTGALISAACVIGAMAAGAPAATCEALRGYGADVGLAFQIYDDVLDATATSDQLGKTAGKDAADGKSTFVTLLGAGAARAEAERLAARAVDRLRQAGLVSPTLAGLARYIVTRPN